MRFFLYVGILLGIIFGLVFAEKRIVCYYGTWATYRHGNGAFNVEDIDANLCTHLIYTFFGITSAGTVQIIDPYLDLEENWGRGNIKKFNDLKLINPKLKTLAAVGGWNQGSLVFSQVARSAALRRTFAREAVSFCKSYGFDGLDVDWEYPGQRDGDVTVDKLNYELLLQDLRRQFDHSELLLTAAVASAEFSASISYDIPRISRYLDFMNIMAYDLHGPWDHKIGINAPLYVGSADFSALQRQLNVNASIHYWLREGASRDKIVLGMPLYGRTFTLRDATQTTIGSYHSGPGQAGQYTNEPGMIGYNEFCEKQLTSRWSRNWEPQQEVPYAYSGNQWIGYEDIESISLKADYVNDLQLGGAMVWSIETDDFLGICGQGNYPLIRTIKRVLNNGDASTTVSPTEDVTIDLTMNGTSASTSESGNSPTSHPNTEPITEFTSTITTGSPSDGTSDNIVESTPTASPSTANEIQSSWHTSSTTAKPSSSTGCIADIYRDPSDCAAFYKCDHGTEYHFQCPAPLLFDDYVNTCNWAKNVQC